MNNLYVIILAAGKGTRMKSSLQKALHKICGRPMLQYVVDAVLGLKPTSVIVVIGQDRSQVRKVLRGPVDYVIQREQLGTGHAARKTERILKGKRGDVLVVCGDTPLITTGTLKRLLKNHRGKKVSASVLTALVDDPAGYGRIIRTQGGNLKGIIEEKDVASMSEKRTHEINTGIYCFDCRNLFGTLRKLKCNNRQKEYYLTDVIGILTERGEEVGVVKARSIQEVMGVNDRIQLMEADRVMRGRIAHRLMTNCGVTIMDPQSTFIHAGVKIGRDTVVYPSTFIEGKTVIGSSCRIGPHAHLVDSKIGNEVELINIMLNKCYVESKVKARPFSYHQNESLGVKKTSERSN